MLKLEEKLFELDGKQYRIRCNMAVLEEVEDAHGGSLDEVQELPSRTAAREFLAAMLNEEERQSGTDKRWTAEELRHKLSLGMLRELDVLGMVGRALSTEQENREGEDAGN